MVTSLPPAGAVQLTAEEAELIRNFRGMEGRAKECIIDLARHFNKSTKRKPTLCLVPGGEA